MTVPVDTIIDESERPGKPEAAGSSLFVEVALQGRLLEARVCGLRGRSGREEEKGRSGRRGRVSGPELSRWSRRRLQKLLARVEGREGEWLRLWTLTYPPERTPERIGEAKAQLRAWLKRMMRRYPGLVVVWRLEPQKNGRPHFHLVTWGAYIHHAEAWEAWREVTGSRWNRAFVYVQAVRAWKRAAQYITKYVGKEVWAWWEGGDGEGPPSAGGSASAAAADGGGRVASLDLCAYWAEAGRLWGVERRCLLPLGELEVVKMGLRAFYRLRRAARHCWRGVGGRRYSGFSLFTDDLGSWGALVVGVAG